MFGNKLDLKELKLQTALRDNMTEELLTSPVSQSKELKTQLTVSAETLLFNPCRLLVHHVLSSAIYCGL